MGTTSRRNEVDTFLSSSAPDSLNNLTQSRAIEAYNGNEGDNIINHLDIAEGLKEILLIHSFDLESLLIIRPHDLAGVPFLSFFTTIK